MSASDTCFIQHIPSALIFLLQASYPMRRSNKPSRHVVQVTVLGFSGITVKRGTCRDVQSVTDPNPGSPAPPHQMQALVAFTNEDRIVKGRTRLSYCLERRKTELLSLQSKDYQQKHVAIWGSDDSNELGSVVTFEEELNGGKTFGLTIAMAEEGSDIALPFGMSEFLLQGDECRDGSSLTLNVPVVPITYSSEMKPLSFLAVAPAKRERFFSRMKKKKKILPSLPEQKAFNDTYSIVEPSRNNQSIAILRILLEIYEKGSDLEKLFVGRRMRGEPYNVVEGAIPTILPTDKKKESIALKQFEMAEISIPLRSQLSLINSSFSMTTLTEEGDTSTVLESIYEDTAAALEESCGLILPTCATDMFSKCCSCSS
mmetsp:Transcript_20736/g.30690  ORF Transcript_20736/g.30690 Transcript_20736/m.30690 type:complete len:372 (-) Transcript_20736:822-1937(-)